MEHLHHSLLVHLCLLTLKLLHEVIGRDGSSLQVSLDLFLCDGTRRVLRPVLFGWRLTTAA